METFPNGCEVSKRFKSFDETRILSRCAMVPQERFGDDSRTNQNFPGVAFFVPFFCLLVASVETCWNVWVNYLCDTSL
jgi:hypothetical protein